MMLLFASEYSRLVFFVVFFFKQKTADERRISDWSSDVCSSDLLALQRRQVIDKQLAVEVIHFVLDAHRQQALGIHFKRLAVAIQRTHANALGAADLGENGGHRQTAFLTILLAIARQD